MKNLDVVDWVFVVCLTVSVVMIAIGFNARRTGYHVVFLCQTQDGDNVTLTTTRFCQSLNWESLRGWEEGIRTNNNFKSVLTLNAVKLDY